MNRISIKFSKEEVESLSQQLSQAKPDNPNYQSNPLQSFVDEVLRELKLGCCRASSSYVSGEKVLHCLMNKEEAGLEAIRFALMRYGHTSEMSVVDDAVP